MRWTNLALPLLLSTACAAPAPAPADPAVLLEADRAFDADVAARGSAAWVEWFAPDGAMVQPRVGELRGPDAIAGAMAALDEPERSLRWQPLRADIAAGGDLGWTTGTWVAESPDGEGGTRRAEGIYVSIWRRQPDGSYKVVMDLGNPTGP